MIGSLSPAPGKACGLKVFPSGCLLEHILYKKEDLGVSERLVSRKAQLKVKRALGGGVTWQNRGCGQFQSSHCFLWLLRFLLIMCTEFISCHTDGGCAWSAWIDHTRKTGKLDLGIQGLLPWGLGRYRERRLGKESREEEWEEDPGLRLVKVPCWQSAEADVGPGQRGLRSGGFQTWNRVGHLLHLWVSHRGQSHNVTEEEGLSVRETGREGRL